MRWFWVWLLAPVLPANTPEPGLVLVCMKGEVYPKSGMPGHGENCVLHDKAGHSYSVQFASIFDDGSPEP